MVKRLDEEEIAQLVWDTRIKAKNARYRVIEEIGVGGNSAVYLVTATNGPSKGVLFALKLFRNVADEVRSTRFKNEVTFLEKCNHPSILRVYDSGEFKTEDYSFPYVIVEYLPKTLRDAMREGIPMIQKIAFTLQLLSGLQYLSELTPPIIHRDIKPENILVRGRSCVFADFGLIKSGEQTDPTTEFRVEPSSGVRFPRYYPTPDLLEYCKCKDDTYELTTKSDVFQLGLVLAELYSGHLPIEERKNAYSSIEIKPLEGIKGSQALVIEQTIKRMLELDPENRATPSELFDHWDGVFREAAAAAKQLEGCIFT